MMVICSSNLAPNVFLNIGSHHHTADWVNYDLNASCYSS